MHFVLRQLLVLACVTALASCSSPTHVTVSDSQSPIQNDPGQSTGGSSDGSGNGQDPSENPGSNSSEGGDGETFVPIGSDPTQAVDPLTLGSYELRLDATRFELIEANENGVTVPINISRVDGHVRPVQIRVTADTEQDTSRLDVKFDNNELIGDETYTEWRAELGVAMGPTVFHERRFRVHADDGREQFEQIITLDVTPIAAPDVYLLIGQSNMEGTSELGARNTDPGGADEVNPRIQQLNVKQNDRNLFDDPQLFTDENFNVMSPRYINAEDPLHEPRFSFRSDKEGSFIGLGLSFAKAALAETNANIVLVPAAWSGRGFCGNDDPPLSWNANTSDEPALGGTLLTDRAITRLNMTLRDTGGVFRGILWHQGEADSNNPICAQRYENNVMAMANRIRTEAFEDARGQGARGENAPVPFVLGTLSRGIDERGDYSIFSPTKQQVDNAHRNIPNILAFSEIATADDLVPPAYPCGQNSCIHFGAEAYRELGARYFRALQRVIEKNR